MVSVSPVSRRHFAQKKKFFQRMGNYGFLFAADWVIILTTFVRRIFYT